MSDELPEGWASTRVGELFASHGGGTPNRGTVAYWNGNIPWLSSGDIKATFISESSETITKRGLEASAARLCRKGSVLVVVRSGILKHTLPVAVLEREAAINQDIKSFDSGHDELNRWLSLAWRASARKLLTENREGTTVQSVKLETLNNFVLPLAPLAEQQRIVAKLTELLGKVDASQQRLAKIPVLLKRFRQSVLAAACSGRLTADWREERVAEGAESGEDSPEGWRNAPLSEFLESSFYGPRFGKESYASKGVPTIRTTDMGFDGSIVLTDAPRIKLSREELEKYCLRHGDLVVTRTGATIGKCAVYDEARGPAIPGAYLIRFRFKLDLVEPKYVLRFFMSPAGQHLLIGGSNAVAQPNVNATTISQFVIPVPSLPEQQEIVRRVEGLFALADQLEVRLAKARGQVDQLTPSLLARAFAGKLVPQDPADEPASALLERVQTKNSAKSKI